MSYDQIRHLADSWGLVFMTILFLSFTGWAFRKGSDQRNRDAANSIFRDEDHG
jgi:cytochrome c oxidase cbb3-type subunit IV